MWSDRMINTQKKMFENLYFVILTCSYIKPYLVILSMSSIDLAFSHMLFICWSWKSITTTVWKSPLVRISRKLGQNSFGFVTKDTHTYFVTKYVKGFLCLIGFFRCRCLGTLLSERIYSVLSDGKHRKRNVVHVTYWF